MYEFHVSRQCREKYNFDQGIFKFDGNVIFSDFLAARKFTARINQKRDLINFPETAIQAGDINAIGLIDEILHLVIALYRKQIDPKIMNAAFKELQKAFGEQKLDQTLLQFTVEFPPVVVYQGKKSEKEYLESKTNGTPNKLIALEEMLMLWVTNQNPAVVTFGELFEDTHLSQTTAYHQMMNTLQTFFIEKPKFGPNHEDLITMLRSPAIAEPYSLSGQLEFIRQKWGALIGDYLYRLLNSIDLIHEENRAAFDSPGPTRIPSFEKLPDEENFSPDRDWMPNTVMIAKNTHVWLYQLSEKYNRKIQTLDQIPDEELDTLANWGFSALWMIGLWERSPASKRIKQLCGNPEAVASAYSLLRYNIAAELGGEEAYLKLREKTRQRGIRLASDMVPNHMGIDSDWVKDHPDWFVALPHSPYPSYSFKGPDLSQDEQLSFYIEDGYYDRTDAAVVFKRVDRSNGDTKYIYHGNDGTSMPWNDTAQLNYLHEDVRESVIQTILEVARKFSIIRFDAAMTLTKKHYQRLWFPQPGTGGAIPSRAEYGLTKKQFDQAFPKEFWREVVDRVAEEIPDTLLLAEAFWLMEGYFVRTLGMHRVYNSAFMNMLRNEENSKYRMVIKNTLEFDPQILKRYVNFMNNPDEKTAVEQFGKGDKYFGVCTLMATMPGLPMFGHGQIEGFSEKYGMEYFRPYWDEEPNQYLIQRHQQEIFPLLKRREIFSGIRHFLLYDFITDENSVDENVFAYSNGNGHERTLVIYHNHFGSTSGWIRHSTSYKNKSNGRIESKSLYQGLNLHGRHHYFVIFRDYHSGLQFIRSSQEINDRGLFFDLDAYKYHVFLDFNEVKDNQNGQYARLNAFLNGRGVPNITEALHELMLSPILTPIRDLISPQNLTTLYQTRIQKSPYKLNQRIIKHHQEQLETMLKAVAKYVDGSSEVDSIVREAQRGIIAILKLPVFEDYFPFPGSEQYQAVLEYIRNNLGQYPFIWYVLTIWNDLRLIGKVITKELQFAEISRSWLDEWGIVRIVQEALIGQGLDPQQAASGVRILKLLTSHQNWTEQLETLTSLSLIKNWFSSEEIRQFLEINRYHDILWFNKEAFESLLWWMMTSALIRLVAEPEKSLNEVLEITFKAFQLIEEILKAEKESEFQVEKLLEGLK